MTSTKKKDNMPCVTNITAANPVQGGTYVNGAAVLTGGNTYIIPWIAICRPVTDYTGGFGRPIEQAVRTRSEVYMRGLREQIQIQTNTGMPWMWRRVCFTMKGIDLRRNVVSNFQWTNVGANGMNRLVNNASTTAPGAEIVNLIFDGNTGTDWQSVYAAKTDKERITVKYDKTRTFNAGTESGTVRNFVLWHQMNSNLRFDDDESGDGMSTNAFSTTSKRGMGDYYVVDIIASGTGGTAEDLLSFQPQATLYWHEK